MKRRDLTGLLGCLAVACAIPDVVLVDSFSGAAGNSATGGVDSSSSGAMSTGGVQASGGTSAPGGGAGAGAQSSGGRNAAGGAAAGGAAAGGNATGGNATGGNAIGGNATGGKASGGGAGGAAAGGSGAGGATGHSCTAPGSCDSTQVCNTQYGRCVLKTGPCAVVDPDQLFCDDFESPSLNPIEWNKDAGVYSSTLVAHTGKGGMLLPAFNSALPSSVTSFANEYPIRVSFWVKAVNSQETPQAGPLATFYTLAQKSLGFGVFDGSFGFSYGGDYLHIHPAPAQSATWDNMSWVCVDIQVTNDHAFVARERAENSAVWHQIGPVSNIDFTTTDTVVGVPSVGNTEFGIVVDDFVVAKNDSYLGVCAP